MTDRQTAEVVDYLEREARFMDRQARDVERIPGSPDEVADNKDRADCLRFKAHTFRLACRKLMGKYT